MSWKGYDPHVCPICGKKVFSARELVNHIKIHVKTMEKK